MSIKKIYGIKAIMVIAVIFITLLMGTVLGCQSSTQQTPGTTQPTEESTEAKSTETIELRLSHINSSIHPTHKALEKFAEEVSKRTDGRVKIVLYPSDTLNPPMETYNAVKNGLADIGRAPVGYSSAVMPLNKLFGDAMMGVPTATEAAKIWTEAYKNMPELQQELEGMHVLWLNSTSPLSIGTINKPIHKLEDFKGLILRFPPGLEPLAQAWGASPINMPTGDIYVGLEKGTVDGFYGGSEMLQAMKLAEFTKYVHTNVGMVYGLSWLAMNQKVWDSLPADVQQVFNDLSEWGQELLMESFDEGEMQAREFAKSEGCEFIDIEEAELQRIYEVSWPVFEKIAANLEKQGKPANKVLDELKRLTSQK